MSKSDLNLVSKLKVFIAKKKNNIAKTDSNHIYSKLIRKKHTQNHVNLRWNKKKRKNRKRKENKADLKSSSSKSNRTYLDLIIRHNPIFVLISYLTRLYVLETKFHVLDNRISKAYLWNQKKKKHNLKSILPLYMLSMYYTTWNSAVHNYVCNLRLSKKWTFSLTYPTY